MWEFNPEGPRTLQRFFGTTHGEIWKLLFKAQKLWLETTDDIRLGCDHLATQVSVQFPNITQFTNQRGMLETFIL